MRPERVYFLNLYNVGLWFMFHWSLNNKNTGFGLSIYFLEMKTSLEFLEIFCNTFLKCLWNKLFTRFVFCKMACTELRNEKCFKSSRNLPLSLPYQLFFPCYEDWVFFPKIFNVQFWNCISLPTKHSYFMWQSISWLRLYFQSHSANFFRVPFQQKTMCISRTQVIYSTA